MKLLTSAGNNQFKQFREKKNSNQWTVINLRIVCREFLFAIRLTAKCNDLVSGAAARFLVLPQSMSELLNDKTTKFIKDLQKKLTS